MPTDLPLDPVEMALWTRQRQGVTDEHGVKHPRYPPRVAGHPRVTTPSSGLVIPALRRARP